MALGGPGWSLRRIERETGVRRETASAYLKAAGLPVRSGPPGRRRGKTGISAQASTDLPPRSWPPPSRAPQASACEPYREHVVAALAAGRNAMGIWRDLTDHAGFTGRYAGGALSRFMGLRPIPPLVFTWRRSTGRSDRMSHCDLQALRHASTPCFLRESPYAKTREE